MIWSLFNIPKMGAFDHLKWTYHRAFYLVVFFVSECGSWTLIFQQFNCLVGRGRGFWNFNWTDTLYEKSANANTFYKHFQYKKVCISSQERKENKFLFISGSGGCKYCKTSFLVSLVNPSGAGPTLLPFKGTANKNGIYCSSGTGMDLHLEQAMTCILPIE